jgi:hypothetical protein
MKKPVIHDYGISGSQRERHLTRLVAERDVARIKSLGELGVSLREVSMYWRTLMVRAG